MEIRIMAFIKRKEQPGEISESTESCPRCGFKGSRPQRGWLDSLNAVSGALTAVFGTLVLPGAGAALAWFTFAYQKSSQENEKLQAMVESAVSQDAAKERTAIRVVSCLAKLDKLPAPFALSVLGTVARNGKDQILRHEAYDAIESLTKEEGKLYLAKLDTYDKLEIFCLQAALTPAQSFRQQNLSFIEEYATSDALRNEVASKLLTFSQDASDPQAKIDMLLTVFVGYGDPDMTGRAIPLLYNAVKERDPAGTDSNKDVVDYLVTNVDKVKDLRSQVRLYLARAVVATKQELREKLLAEFAKVAAGIDQNDVHRLLEGIGRTARVDTNPDLLRILDSASKSLASETNKHTTSITQR
jgi:hypothetical protein